MTLNDDQLDQALANLSDHDVDPWRRERGRNRAHKALASSAPGSSYSRVVEPILLAVFCAAQLVWAFDKVASILLG
jgi:hypothetical protein